MAVTNEMREKKQKTHSLTSEGASGGGVSYTVPFGGISSVTTDGMSLSNLIDLVKRATYEELRQLKLDNEELNNELKTLKKEIKRLEPEIKGFKDTVTETEKKETKIIETLGIFFALFAFISVNVQIYTRIADVFSASIFTLLVFSLLSSIIILFDLLLHQRFKYVLYYFGFVGFCLLLSILSISYLKNIPLNPIDNTKAFDTAVDQRLQKNYYSKEETNKLIQKQIKLESTPSQ